MNELTPIEYNNQRILTTQQLAENYNTEAKIISNNFNRNKKKYIKDKHYYVLEGEGKREFLNLHQIEDGLKNAVTLYLWTERGALLHAKSLNTDKAWQVYENLVETYFKVQETKEIAPIKTNMDALKMFFNVLEYHNSEITEIKEDLKQLKEREPIEVVLEEPPKSIRVKKEYTNEQILLSGIRAEFLTSPVLYSSSDIARVFRIGNRRMIAYLVKHGILTRYKSTQNHTINERYSENGYTFERTRKSKTTESGIYRHLSWTEKGAEFVIEFLEAKGMKPQDSLRHENSRKTNR